MPPYNNSYGHGLSFPQVTTPPLLYSCIRDDACYDVRFHDAVYVSLTSGRDEFYFA